MKHPLKNEIDKLTVYNKIGSELESIYETCLTYAINHYDTAGGVTQQLIEVLDAIAPIIPEEDIALVQHMYEEMGTKN
jgi:hypothetical protein